MDECETRTQGAFAAAGCSLGGARLRTRYRAAQGGLGGRSLIVNQVSKE
jgi:hypothetical protein